MAQNFDPGLYTSQRDSLAWTDPDGSLTAYYFTKQDFNRSVLGEEGGIYKTVSGCSTGRHDLGRRIERLG